MALKIGTVIDRAGALLRDDAFSSAAKNGAAKTGLDRSLLSKTEAERYARYGLTYAGAEQVREERAQGPAKRSTTPAALVYQTALKSLNDELGSDVDRNARVTPEWLEELTYNSPAAGALLNLAAAESPDDPLSFAKRLDGLTTFFGDNDIDMGGGVWTDTGKLPRGSNAADHAMKLLKTFVGEREEAAEEKFKASNYVKNSAADLPAGIRAAGLSIAADGFGESSHESALGHATQIASLIKRMGDGVTHASASVRLVGESLQGDTPVFAQVHLFTRPNGNYVAFSTIGGQASRSWED